MHPSLYVDQTFG